MRYGGAPGNVQSVWNKVQVTFEILNLEGNLVILLKDQNRHPFIRDRDSGQIEALDRDYAKASSMHQSAPYSPYRRAFRADLI